MSGEDGYKKLRSAGLDRRVCTLAIKLTETEYEAAKALAAENGLSASGHFGLFIIKYLENQGRLEAGYTEALKASYT